MYEKIRVAYRKMVCDVCGQSIFIGQKYRAIHTEEQPTVYNEHIRCPGAPATAEVKEPSPIKPKINFNHAISLAYKRRKNGYTKF